MFTAGYAPYVDNVLKTELGAQRVGVEGDKFRGETFLLPFSIGSHPDCLHRAEEEKKS